MCVLLCPWYRLSCDNVRLITHFLRVLFTNLYLHLRCDLHRRIPNFFKHDLHYCIFVFVFHHVLWLWMKAKVCLNVTLYCVQIILICLPLTSLCIYIYVWYNNIFISCSPWIYMLLLQACDSDILWSLSIQNSVLVFGFTFVYMLLYLYLIPDPDSKVHGANMGPTWKLWKWSWYIKPIEGYSSIFVANMTTVSSKIQGLCYRMGKYLA